MIVREETEHRGALRTPGKEPTRTEIFHFLEMLRESGKTNMMGAPAYIEHYFDLDKQTAQDHFWAWVKHPQRVAELTQLISQ